MSAKRLWNVTIECWFEKGKKVDSVRRVFEVEAVSIYAAQCAAIDFADQTANPGKKWIRFEFIKLHSCEYQKFPREVTP